MAHPSQTDFVRRTAAMFPAHFNGCRVLEIGSHNINGSVREFFSDCEYIGLDAREGPDVDVVGIAHEFDGGPFDTIISCEAFEHDPYFTHTLDAVKRMLRPFGLFVATWAGRARDEHGTLKSNGLQWGPDPHYYRGIGALAFLALVGDAYEPRQMNVKYDARGWEQDVYFWGVKVADAAASR